VRLDSSLDKRLTDGLDVVGPQRPEIANVKLPVRNDRIGAPSPSTVIPSAALDLLLLLGPRPRAERRFFRLSMIYQYSPGKE